MPASLRLALLFVYAAPLRLLAGDPQCEVNVNANLTEAGKKVPRPSKAEPVFYFPLVASWREEGAIVAGEKPPPRLMVVHQLAKALAEQGYLVFTPEKTPLPSLLLVFHWGYMNPQIDDVGSDVENPQQVFFNQKEMLALVGGQTLVNLDLQFEREAVIQGAEEDRYFVIVSAYDFDAARQHKKVLLWQARMSTPSAGLTMAEVVPALIKGGGPLFGRETLRPEWVTTPIIHEGKVEIGTPTVVPDAPHQNGATEKKP